MDHNIPAFSSKSAGIIRLDSLSESSAGHIV